MMRYNPLLLGVILALLSSAACKNDEVSSYRAPKAASAGPGMQAPMSGGMPSDGMGSGLPMPPAAVNNEIKWRAPKGWKELPPSEMRTASFSAEGKDGLKADISVVVLAGPGGGDLANINRWRGQLNLGPISEAELPSLSKKISPGGRAMLLSSFVSSELFIDNRYKKRMVAAIYSRGDNTWFFKMTGEDALVRSLEPSFLQFLENLSFGDAR